MCGLPVWGNPYVRQVNRQVINKLGVQECAEILSVYSPPFFQISGRHPINDVCCINKNRQLEKSV